MRHITYLLKMALAGAIGISLLAGCSPKTEVDNTTSAAQTESAGGAPSTESKAEEAPTAESETKELPDPVPAQNGAADFEKMDVKLAPPAGAENVAYSTVGDSIAQIEFTVNGVPYTYRASSKVTNISGIYDDFDPAVMALSPNSGDTDLTVSIKTIKKGGRLAIWKKANVYYSLYTPNEMTDDAIADFVMSVAMAEDVN